MSPLLLQLRLLVAPPCLGGLPLSPMQQPPVLSQNQSKALYPPLLQLRLLVVSTQCFGQDRVLLARARRDDLREPLHLQQPCHSPAACPASAAQLLLRPDEREQERPKKRPREHGEPFGAPSAAQHDRSGSAALRGSAALHWRPPAAVSIWGDDGRIDSIPPPLRASFAASPERHLHLIPRQRAHRAMLATDLCLPQAGAQQQQQRVRPPGALCRGNEIAAALMRHPQLSLAAHKWETWTRRRSTC